MFFQFGTVNHTTFVDCSILVTDICTLVTHFALWFGINCSKIDQSQSNIISMYIINEVTAFFSANQISVMFHVYNYSFVIVPVLLKVKVFAHKISLKPQAP